MVELPKELRKPVRDKKEGFKKSKWAQKFNGLHCKGRSKHWQNMQSLAGPSSKPMPCAKSSKKQRAKAVADGESAAVAKPKRAPRHWWRNRQLGKKAAAVIDEGVGLAQPVGMATAGSHWIQKFVRVISDKVGPELLNRSGIVTAVVPLADGTLDLRVQCLASDHVNNRFYISSQDVIVELADPVSADLPAVADSVGTLDEAVAVAVPITTPIALDFKAVNWNEQDLAGMYPKPVTLKVGATIEYHSISYAVMEMAMRFKRSDFSFMCPAVAAPFTFPASLSDSTLHLSSEQDAVFKAMQDLKLNTCAVLYAVVGSGGHFVLLEAERPPPGQSAWKLTYYDALKSPSQQCMIAVQRLADTLMFGQVIPKPSNNRHQIDAWSCGLWCLQFMEESIRARCGEKKQYLPMNLNFLITRTNKFMAMAVKKQKTILVPSVENGLSSATTASTSIAVPLNTASAADAPSSASTASASAADSPSSASTATASTAVVAARQIDTVPVADPDFTYEMAVAAGSRCSKCRIADCFT